MSLKYDKDFFRGLFTLEESNKYLFITPVCFFLLVTSLSIGMSFMPPEQGDKLTILTMTFLFSGLASFFIIGAINQYLYKHVLRYNPFENSENKDKEVAAVFMLSLYSGMSMLFAVPFLLSDLANPTVKVPFLSLYTLLSLVCSVVLFAVIQSFFKLHILGAIHSIMVEKNQTTDLKETEI